MKSAEVIQELWLNEVKQLEWQGKPLRLIILGEAPLSPSKYFYVKNGNYLRELKKIYLEKCKIEDLAMMNYHLYRDRILLLELFKEPLPTDEFDNDTKMEHWDSSHFSNQLNILSTAGLLDKKHTKIVFRYKKLCQNLAAKGKKVEEHINAEILPIFERYGLTKDNFLLEYNNGKERYATISTGSFGNGDELNKNTIVYQYLNQITNCNLNLLSYSEESDIFKQLLDFLKVGPILKPIMRLDLDSKQIRNLIREDVKNIEENINFEENVEKRQNLHKLTMEYVFELLGYFSNENPDSISLLPISIYLSASRNRWKLEDLWRIIYIHECAHYIHQSLNNFEFDHFPFEIDGNPKSCHRLYVESFAQLCTELFFRNTSKTVLMIFDELKVGQPIEYIDYSNPERWESQVDIRKLEFYFVRDTFLIPKNKKKYKFKEWFHLELLRIVKDQTFKDLMFDLTSTLGDNDIPEECNTYKAHLENNGFYPFISVD